MTAAIFSAQKNMVQNPGFEEGSDKWEILSDAVLDTKAGISGADNSINAENASSLRYATKKAASIYLAQQTIQIIPGEEYEFGTMAACISPGQNAVLGVTVVQFNAEKKNIGSSTASQPGDRLGESFREIKGTFKADAEAKTAVLLLRCINIEDGGTVWFENVFFSVLPPQKEIIPRPLPLFISIGSKELSMISIVHGTEEKHAALEIQNYILKKTGRKPDILPDDPAELNTKGNNLIIIGNLATCRVHAALYEMNYTYEDHYFPGTNGYVIRPLANPLGNGKHIIIISSSQADGIQNAVKKFNDSCKMQKDMLIFPFRLIVNRDPSLTMLDAFPLRFSGANRDELGLSSKYLRSADSAFSAQYKETVLNKKIKNKKLVYDHLLFYYLSQSWDIMEPYAMMSDEERKTVINALLDFLRSSQGLKYYETWDTVLRRGGIGGNHLTRFGIGFYYAVRHLRKYYSDQVTEKELTEYERNVRYLWESQLSSYRSLDEVTSQHNYGGSLENHLTMALQMKDLGEKFVKSGNAAKTAIYCAAIVNNLGMSPYSGDCSAGDYPASVFTKLSWLLQDGTWIYLANKRQMMSSSDEAFRGFNSGILPVIPSSLNGLQVIAPLEPRFSVLYTPHMDGSGASMPREGISADTITLSFDKIYFRDGFEPEDAYLLLDGVGEQMGHSFSDQNTVLEFSQSKRVWIAQPDPYGIWSSLEQHNALTFIKDGLAPKQIPLLAMIEQHGSDNGFHYTRTKLDPYGDSVWHRHIFKIAAGAFFVLDELTCGSPGYYKINSRWYLAGDKEYASNSVFSRQDGWNEPDFWFGVQQIKKNAEPIGSSVFTESGLSFTSLAVAVKNIGDGIRFTLEGGPEGTYDTAIRLKGITMPGIQTPASGTVRVVIDGKEYARNVDLATHSLAEMFEVPLGRHVWEKNSPRTILVTSDGKNASSQGYNFEIISVILRKKAVKEPSRFTLAHASFGQESTISAEFDRGNRLYPRFYASTALHRLDQTVNGVYKKGSKISFPVLFQSRLGDYPELKIKKTATGTFAVICAENTGYIGVSGQNNKEVQTDAEFLYFDKNVFFCVAGSYLKINGENIFLKKTKSSFAGKINTSRANEIQILLDALRKKPEYVTDAPDSDTRTAAPSGIAAEVTVTLQSGGQLAVLEQQKGRSIVAASEGSTLSFFDRSGTPLQKEKLDGTITALETVTISQKPCLLAGTRSGTVYFFDRTKLIWKKEIPHIMPAVSWYTSGNGEVRSFQVYDSGGNVLILAGTGDSRIHALSETGETNWSQYMAYGVPVCISVCDVFASKENNIIAGLGSPCGVASAYIYDRTGTLKANRRLFPRAGSAVTGLLPVTVSERAYLFSGNSIGCVQLYETGKTGLELKWEQNTAGKVHGLFTMHCPDTDGQMLVSCSDSGALCAWNTDGTMRWNITLPGEIITACGIQSDAKDGKIAAADKNGHLYVISNKGEIISRRKFRTPLHKVMFLSIEKKIVLAGSDKLILVNL